MSAATIRQPDSAHWLFLYLLNRMQQVLEKNNLIYNPSFNNRVRLRHVMFIAADELRRNFELDLGLQTTLHIEDIQRITKGPTIANILQQCIDNGWIASRPNEAMLYELTDRGQIEMEQVIRECRPIARLGCPQPVPVDSLLAFIDALAERWVLAHINRLQDFYRDVVLRNAVTSRVPVAHYEIFSTPQAERFIAAARR